MLPRVGGWLAAVALVGGLAAFAGIPVRASYGAQVTADEPQYLLSAISIAEDGNLDISDELAAQRWRDFHEAGLPEQTKPLPDGRRISPHDPLLPLLLALPMALGGWMAAKALLAVLAAVLAAAIAWTAIRRFAVLPALAAGVTGIFAVSMPLASYGHQVYPELPAALAVTGAIAALRGPLRRAGCWGLAAAVIALPWLAVKYAPVAAVLAVLGLVTLWRSGRRGAAVGLVITGVCAAAAFAVIHLEVWGGLTPYATGDHFVGGELDVVGFSPDYLGRSSRLIGLLIDRHFGIVAWQPAWLALPAAVVLLIRRREPGWTVLVLPLLAGWLTATYVALTMHGYWSPGRQIVVVLPAGVIAIAVLASRWRGVRMAILASGLLGIWSYAWLVVVGRRGQIAWIVDFFRTSDPWYRTWSRLLPAYTALDAWQWVRHGAWLILVAATVVVVWRSARAAHYSDGASVAVSVPDADPDAEPEPEPEADPDEEPPSSIVRTPEPSSAPQAGTASSSRTAAAKRDDQRRRDTGSSSDRQ